MFKMISGALEPSAINVRLASVGFQTFVLLMIFSPSAVVVTIALVCEVITSIESMNTSEMMAIPINR